MTYDTLFINVTNNSVNFTAGTSASTGWTKAKPGDLIAIRSADRGTILLELATIDATAKTGTFTAGYTAATAQNVYSIVIPTSKIDPGKQTVISTELLVQVTAALAADQRMGDNWQQILTVPSGNVDVIAPDGSKITGPSWRGILNAVLQKDVPGQVLNQPLGINGSLVLNDSTAKPGNLDVGGFARFRKSVTFDDTIVSNNGFSANNTTGVGDPSIRLSFTRAEASGSITGSVVAAGLKHQNQTQAMNMACVKVIGITDYGYVSYLKAAGGYVEVRFQNNNDVNNIAGSWVTGSDRRIKDKIEVIEDPIALIRGLELYSFERDGKPSVGGIAQEIEKTLPLLVNVGGNFTLQSGVEVEQVKSVDYGTLGYVAVAALNKALDKIDALEKRLAALEAK